MLRRHPVVQFPLQPRIRRQSLAATIQAQARASDASERVHRAFVCSVLMTVVVLGIAVVPEMVSLVDGIPDAVASMSGGTLIP